jgi:glycosyltransferase involved in cell wall biosynthesis
MSVATANLMRVDLGGWAEVVHLDTADRRDLKNVGRVDARNVALALRHGVQFFRTLSATEPPLVYVPIAQSTLGFLRDAQFLGAALATGSRLVVHLHGGYFDEFYQRSSPPMRALIRATVGRSVCGIVLGRSLEGVFDGVLPRDRIRIVPNGIDDFFAAMSAREDSAESRFHVLFLGTLSADKGVLTALRAAALVKQECRDVMFTFVGGWRDEATRGAAERLVVTNGLAGTVRFLPPVGPPQKYDHFRDADVFVFPTDYKYEGHPYVIIEAMCAATPVITTRRGCIPEMFEDGEGGWQFPKPDPREVADAILTLRDDHDLALRMGRHNRECYLERFTLARWMDDMRDVFRRALGVE